LLWRSETHFLFRKAGRSTVRPGTKGRECPGGRVRPAADGQAGLLRPGKESVVPESLGPSGIVTVL
jgi:hypothetical protein